MIASTQIWTLHHDTDAFPNPDRFDPDRWLKFDSKAKELAMKEAFMPFGIGPRACIGKTFAIQEINQTMAAVFRRFDITIEPSMTESDSK